jgi:peptidoglycan hydrolase CwlO-like protein
MNELVEASPGVSEQQESRFPGTTDGTLTSFVDNVREQSERLASIASACQKTAHEIAEREASVRAREQSLAGRERELDTRHDELERRKQQLNELAAETAERIEEAARRESELRAAAREVLHRYEAPSGG